jgi:hypothetical protein
VAPVQPGNPHPRAGHEGRPGNRRRRAEPARGVPHRVELADDRRLRAAGAFGKLGDDVELTAALERRSQISGGLGGATGHQVGGGVDKGVALVAGNHGRTDLLAQPWVQVWPEPVIDDIEDLKWVDRRAADQRDRVGDRPGCHAVDEGVDRLAVGRDRRSDAVAGRSQPGVDPGDAALADLPEHLGDVEVGIEARGVAPYVGKHCPDERLRSPTDGGRRNAQPQHAGGQHPSLGRRQRVDAQATEELLRQLRELGIGQDLGVNALVRIGANQRLRVHAGIEQPPPNEHHRRDENEPDHEARHQEQRWPRPGPLVRDIGRARAHGGLSCRCVSR